MLNEWCATRSSTAYPMRTLGDAPARHRLGCHDQYARGCRRACAGSPRIALTATARLLANAALPAREKLGNLRIATAVAEALPEDICNRLKANSGCSMEIGSTAHLHL